VALELQVLVLAGCIHANMLVFVSTVEIRPQNGVFKGKRECKEGVGFVTQKGKSLHRSASFGIVCDVFGDVLAVGKRKNKKNE